jgi:hypothetical protein
MGDLDAAKAQGRRRNFSAADSTSYFELILDIGAQRISWNLAVAAVVAAPGGFW